MASSFRSFFVLKLLFVGVLLVLPVGVPDVHAAPSVAVSTLAGPQGAAAAQTLRRALREQIALTTTEQATVIVRGTVVQDNHRWTIRLRVFSAATREQLAQRAFPLAQNAVNQYTADQIADWVVAVAQREDRRTRPASKHIARKRPPPKRRAARPPRQTAPPQVPVREAPLAFAPEDVTVDLSADPRPSSTPPPPPPPQDGHDPLSMPADVGLYPGAAVQPAEGRPAAPSADTQPTPPRAEPLIEAAVDLFFFTRSFAFTDLPENPPHATDYATPGIAFALGLQGTVFPFSRLSGVITDFGLALRYHHVLGLRSSVEGDPTPSGTTSQCIEIGPRYRWNVLGHPHSPLLRFGLDYGYHNFLIDRTPPPLPGLKYSYLKLVILDATWAFYQTAKIRVGLLGAFDYLFVLSAGPIEATDASGFGDSSTGGIDFKLGVFFNYDGFFARLAGYYRRYFFDFSNTCVQQGTGCQAAGGAVDEYGGAVLSLGYTY